MTSLHRNPSPKLPPDWLLGLAIALVVTGIPSILRHFSDRQNYEKALNSYRVADCDTAIEGFDKVINGFRLIDPGNYRDRAAAKKAECEFFQDAVSAQQNGDFESALSNYAKAALYENSALEAPAKQKIRELFENPKIATKPTLRVCNRLEVLTQKNLLPDSESSLTLYPECGQLYEAEKNYEAAIATYQRFLQRYPERPLAATIKRALARTTVDEIRTLGARNIKPPAQTGTTADGTTVIEIQNTSPAIMEITFSGATPKFETIEPCENCIVYAEPPKFCPGEGHFGRYTLESGQYDIAVKFKATDGSRVRPWAGTWSLAAGAEYDSCFFIIRDPAEESETAK